ncbi:hypothetical protein F7734_23660 [Scytonema sp. UIC 10036]|uniref:hypothetical protein n=1 Tax=Scytonema sp. UIC 10036 TaxID=2304196 RepID=UPI0012DA39A1|nr:hypothetical protein [Scytonema sp. UIC 10036]MUG95191.1 hypothetical protein [Scytonema sp. UIC 10036]
MKNSVNLLLKCQSRYSVVTKTFCAVLIFNTLINPVFAQSTDPDKPTPLSSNEITGRINIEGSENYYTFTALPGEIVVKLDVRPESQDIGISDTEVVLLTKDAEKIERVYASASRRRGSSRSVKRVRFTRETPVIIRILARIPSGYKTTEASYRIQLEGNFKTLPRVSK